MALRRFLRALLRGDGRPDRPRHSGDELAEEVRDAMGPQVGGDVGGRLTGSAQYEYLENRTRD